MQATEGHTQVQYQYISRIRKSLQKAGCWETPTLKMIEGQENTGEREYSFQVFFLLPSRPLIPTCDKT